MGGYDMKKIVLVLLVLFLICASISAQEEEKRQLRLGVLAGTAFTPDEKHTDMEDVMSNFDSGHMAFGGLYAEYLHGNTGIGMLVQGLDDSLMYSGAEDEVIKLEAACFLGYHFFGPEAFFDPFVDTGMWSHVGLTRMYIESARHEDDVVSFATPPEIVVSPFVSLGFAFNIQPLVLGIKTSYVPFEVQLTPSSEYAFPEIGKRVTLYVLFAPGC